MNNTANTNDIRISIINLITKINDIEKLKLIHQQAEKLNKIPKEGNALELKPNYADSIVEVDEGVSFQQILNEQDYRPISYQKFREIADQIEWEHSLEELLDALD
ncbi:MAG: hypothetical protein MI974_08025 [Chitinophagales bacterium]|nr:hypothetical protein [Chitinophagales bacterium]